MTNKTHLHQKSARKATNGKPHMAAYRADLPTRERAAKDLARLAAIKA